MGDAFELIWKEFDSLLEEAVIESHYYGVEMLLIQEKLLDSRTERYKPSSYYKPKNIKPFILSINNGDIDVTRLFFEYNYEISMPHIPNCPCDSCQGNKLGETRDRILKLKASGNPVWLSLSSDDPFLSLFQLNQLERRFKHTNDSFQREYKALYEENEQVCLDLLHEIRSEEEGEALLKYKSIHRDGSTGNDLSFVKMSINYKQKEVVAHSVIQYFLTKKVFLDIPYWCSSGLTYRIFLVTLIAVSAPLTTLLHIIIPTGCCYSIGDIALQPMVRFISSATSYIIFLVLLSIFGSMDLHGIRHGHDPIGIDIALFIWIIGFCLCEFKQVCRNGLSGYLSNGWNWLDIGMVTLLLFSTVTWIVMRTVHPNIDEHYDVWSIENIIITNHDHDDHGDNDHNDLIMNIADGAFTVAIILSFFRLLYICQITHYLGLLQLCLGEMLHVILQFAFIQTTVLLGFTVAMLNLVNASNSPALHNDGIVPTHANDSVIMSSLSESFNGFFSTLFTMIFVALGMEESSKINDFNDGTLIQLWATILFIVYFGFSIIVIVNILIAMMNNTFLKIADNLSTEYMFSWTSLWLEYIGNENTRPVPLNLIPTINEIISLVNYVRTCWSKEVTLSNQEITSLENDARKRYKNVCCILLDRYILKKYGRTVDDDSYISNKGQCDDPLLHKIKRHVAIWDGVIEARETLPQGNCSCVIEARGDLPQGNCSCVEGYSYDNQLYVSEEDTTYEVPVIWDDYVIM